MPKRKTKKERDFQKVKFKVGKKKPRAENVTSTTFKSRAIVIKDQLKETSADDLRQDILRKNRDPQELLAHLQHYNPSFRLNSLNTIKAIMTSDPHKLTLHIGAVLDRVASLTCDIEKVIRGAALECLKSVFNSMTAQSIIAFVPMITAHLNCAMTHLTEAVMLDSLQFLGLLISHYPNAIRPHLFKLTQNFLDLISTSSGKVKRSLKVTPDSKLSTARWRQQAFAHLENLLSIGDKVEVETVEESSHLVHHIVNGDETTSISVEYGQHMFLSSVGLEQLVVRRSELSMATDQSDGQLLQSFIREVIPLLHETWVELVTDEGGVNGEGRVTLMSIVNIITLLCRMIHSSRIKEPQPILTLIRNEVKHFIEDRFPIISDERKGKQRKSDSMQSAKHVSSALLNVNICSLIGQLGSSKKTAVYMMKCLRGSALHELSDHLDTLLVSLEPGETLETLILHVVHKLDMTDHRLAVVIKAINRLLRHRESISKEIADALVELACLPHIQYSSLLSVLTLINTACLRRQMKLETAHMQSLLQGCLGRFKLQLDGSQEPGSNRSQVLQKVVFLFAHVEQVTADVLKLIKEMLMLSHGSGQGEVNLLLRVLYHRMKDGGLSTVLHVSFLISLLGEGQSDRSAVVVHQHIGRTVLNHIHFVTSNPDQVMAVIEHNYHSYRVRGESLPLIACKSLLTDTKSLQHLSTELIVEMLIQFLLDTLDVNASHVSVDKKTEATEVLSNVMQVKCDAASKTWARLVELLKGTSQTEKELYKAMVEFTMHSDWHASVSDELIRCMEAALSVSNIEELPLLSMHKKYKP